MHTHTHTNASTLPEGPKRSKKQCAPFVFLPPASMRMDVPTGVHQACGF